MSRTSRLILQSVWIILSITAFFSPLFRAAVDNNFYYAMDNMLFGMVFLSFPANIIFLFLIDEIPHTFLTEFHPLIYFSIWLMLFVVGYLQWCWAVPRLFAERQMIRLNLVQTAMEEKELKIKGNDQPVAALPQFEERRVIRIFRVNQFDEQGRTPLERAIGKRSYERF